ncbi:MAG: DNA topoisomerase IB [Acidimicrobiales bacterium]
MPRLRRSDCQSPGYTRRRAGRGFVYFDAEGNGVTDEEQLARFKALALPAAWNDVWICTAPNGHIQATGTDATGRVQYRCHDSWRAAQDREKFDHMLDFARALPGLRHRVSELLEGDGLGPDRVLACAVRLLELGFFRVGSDAHAEENHTYGLATLQKAHAHVRGSTVSFDFIAKGNKRRLQSVVDPEVASIIGALKTRRSGGTDLLAYRNESGRWVDARSDDINRFIRATAGLTCSEKDFRTWNATVLAAVALSVSTAAGSPAARKRSVARAMREVAHYLGNTPAVTRSSYVDPRLVDRYLSGETVSGSLPALGDGTDLGHPATHGAVEAAVIELLAP